MPNSLQRRKYLYIEFQKNLYGHVGKQFFGLVFGRRPLLCAFYDITFYYNVGTFGICITPWIEIGIFIDFRTEEEIRKQNTERMYNSNIPSTEQP